MPRAKRHYIPGHAWHITHRCHKTEFLLKFAKDRQNWIDWLFEAMKRYGMVVLNYMATSIWSGPGWSNIPPNGLIAYGEIQKAPDRYRLIDRKALMELLGINESEQLSLPHRSWVEEALKIKTGIRETR